MTGREATEAIGFLLSLLEAEVQRWREETWPGLPLRASLTALRCPDEPSRELRLALVWPYPYVGVCAYERLPERLELGGILDVAEAYADAVGWLMLVLTPDPPGECYRPEGVP